MAFPVELCALLCLVGFLLYRWGLKNHSYWKDRGVKTPRMTWLFGTFKDVLLGNVSFPEFYRRMHQRYTGERYFGMLSGSEPILMIRDPELIRHILTKDFEYFPNRFAAPQNEKQNPLSANLVGLQGIRWKNLRIKLTPTFTSGKIKRMFPLMTECSEELVQFLEDPASHKTELEMKDVLGKFTTDVIGSCAFGLNCNSFKDPNTQFRKYGLMLFANSSFNKIRLAREILFPNFTLLTRFLSFNKLFEFFQSVIHNSIEFREKNNVKRNDFLDLLVEIKNKGKIVDDSVDLIQDPFLRVPVSTSSQELQFTDDMMVAQAFVFFIAGFETSSTTMSFSVIELAHNPEIQEKARADVDAAMQKYGGLTYEAISEMSYLDKVISETLRKHATAPALRRKCLKRYRLPNSDLEVEPGVTVTISVTGLHYDPEHFPDPERFDPERFSPEAKAARHNYAYLPFVEGPRMCIGMRFALVQSKVGLATLLSKFEFKPSARSAYPVKYRPATRLASSADGCYVFIEKRPSVK